MISLMPAGHPYVVNLLLATDLDRTLIPNGPEPETPQVRALLGYFIQQTGIHLLFISGRDIELIDAAIVEWQLPRPEWVIADVGASIYRWEQTDGWQLNIDWQDHIATDWSGYRRSDITHSLQNIAELKLQEEVKQGAYKVSYYVDLCVDPEPLLIRIADLLKELGVQSNLIWSIDSEKGVGLLDILPKSANKYHALIWLMDQIGLKLHEVVFCGDSGNDLDILVSPIPAVLVANATADVTQVAIQSSSEQGLMDKLYLAQGNFIGMNGNYGTGILEGLCHYHPNLIAELERIKVRYDE